MPEEILTLVNENDEEVGRAPRSVVRRESLLHRSTAILVYDSRGRLLIHKRTASKDINPSLWDLFAGGVVALGETYEEAARRETREEIGIESPELEFLFKIHYHNAHNPCFVGVFKTVYDGPIAFQEEEIEEGRFVTDGELRELIRTRPFVPESLEIWEECLRRRLGEERVG
ncbi:MAG TPA: NUDIX domain-containing protein [Sumerlaeia bacterium]|nr:NUDIX domain-containing protein [Sumerlaeia bacterium]